MLEKSIIAYEKYEKTNENKEQDILKFFKERLIANKEDIIELINISEAEIKYEDIEEIVNKEIEEISNYKKSSYWVITPSNFMEAIVDMPIGVVGVETENILIAIKMWIKAIKTHNAIIIIDKEYSEFDVKHYIYILLRAVLKKFNIEEDLIDHIPYEESIDSDYQKIIKMNNDEDYDVINKEKDNKFILYIEDDFFEKEIENNRDIDYILLKGKYEDIINEINQKEYDAVSIYTKSPEIAYRAMNEVYSENVLINSSLKNVKKLKEIRKKELRDKNAKKNEIECDLFIVKSMLFPFQNTSKRDL